jgi:hypothetical protein
VSDPTPELHLAPSLRGVSVALRVGVPLPRGWCTDPATLSARVVPGGDPLAIQSRILAHWPDRSAKWLLVSLSPGPSLAPAGGRVLLEHGGSVLPAARLAVDVRPSGVCVDTGAARFEFDGNGDRLLAAVTLADGGAALGPDGGRLKVSDASGRTCTPEIDTVEVEEQGPVIVVVVQRGSVSCGGQLDFVARWTIAAGARSAVLELRLRNPRPALHPGGLWDLGDPGSVLLGDVSVDMAPVTAPSAIAWRATPDAPRVDAAGLDWALYQDSSGGEHWDSVNHVEAHGSAGVAFRGWITRGAGDARRGDRAQPAIEVSGACPSIAASVQDFWQNFPKALRCRQGCLSVGLFPDERARPIELQGGEQKRHRIAFAFGPDALDTAEAQVAGQHASIDPAWVEASAAVTGLVADLYGDPAWEQHVRTIVDGPQSFVARREVIDEYGWRNFGDLWADHEAVRHTGPEPFVSHYNNQYDFVFAAGLHAMRTGDAGWARLARESADHTVDIDVYHTVGDRAAFNGGLFWHTDHHRPARTCTHRTYSAANADGGDYGGGPSNEHDYASGLLLHHFRTGDADALEAVVGLADWVMDMDDGARTLLGVVDPGPTGLASRTLDPDYHGPGRGAGNSIATLLDAYVVTGRRAYFDKADELVRRCIHPADDIAARRLDDPERRWSYLVFLQVLGGRYLAVKHELGEIDYLFQYARAALLHYADWMLEHETPYTEVLHKFDLPTESWPAHDIRKCHVMHLAARWDDRGGADRFRSKAAHFYQRCLGDLDTFETRHLTRPLVILGTYGHLHAYFERLSPIQDAERLRWRHGYAFGDPQRFSTQAARLKPTLSARIATLRREITRLVRDRIGRRRAARRSA